MWCDPVKSTGLLSPHQQCGKQDLCDQGWSKEWLRKGRELGLLSLGRQREVLLLLAGPSWQECRKDVSVGHWLMRIEGGAHYSRMFLSSQSPCAESTVLQSGVVRRGPKAMLTL